MSERLAQKAKKAWQIHQALEVPNQTIVAPLSEWVRLEDAQQHCQNANAVAQLFVWELHDKTLFPTKYYKDVLYYLFDVLEGKKTLEDKDVPKSIHWSNVVKQNRDVNEREGRLQRIQELVVDFDVNYVLENKPKICELLTKIEKLAVVEEGDTK